MPKRKRDYDSSQSNDAAAKPRSQHSYPASPFTTTILPYIRSLAATLQSARVPERLKLGRRVKEAKAKGGSESDDARVKRLGEEVECLRVLDVEMEARSHLVKVLGRVRVVREDEEFIEWMWMNGFGSGEARMEAEKNLLGRLFKADGVREIVQECVEAVKDLVAALEAPYYEEMERADREGAESDEEDRSSGAELDDGQEDMSMSGSVSGSDSGSENEHHDRKAVVQTNGNGKSKRSIEVTSGSRGQRPEDSFSSDNEDSTTASESGDRAPSERHHKPSPTPINVKTDSFLSSLALQTTAGYYSGSEPDSEDDSHQRRNIEDVSIPRERKNRRGQKARQKIAVKKYGQKAKHLVNANMTGSNKEALGKPRKEKWKSRRDREKEKENENGDGRNAGWDMKRGAVAAGGDGPPTRVKVPEEKTDRPEHPSWEAARKMKEAKKGVGAFEGKKITFD